MVGAIEVQIGLIGKNPVHRDQREVSEKLLLDSSLCFRMKILDNEDSLADFVEFFDAPSGMVDIHEILQGVTVL